MFYEDGLPEAPVCLLGYMKQVAGVVEGDQGKVARLDFEEVDGAGLLAQMPEAMIAQTKHLQ
jgi:hypothetical protein